MNYLSKKMIIAINKIAIDHSGGTNLSRSNIREGQNLGFVDRIFHNQSFGQKIYPTIYHQAAAYMFHVIKNHAFIDGNKRTGLAAAYTFLLWNDIVFSPLDEDKVFDFVISIAAGPNNPETVIPQIAEWIENESLY